MRIGLAGTGRIGAFHARTLLGLDFVTELVVTDAVAESAQRLSAELGVQHAPDTDAMLADGIDALVIATATPSHAPLLRAGIAAGVPTFCEKPAAAGLAETEELAALEQASGARVHIGFQRRFDVGYRRLQQAVAAGELGFVHTVRANTSDEAPPHASYIPTSGGIFRDCNVHDFDIIRFVTGAEVTSVQAVGGNRGVAFFAEAGDVDTGASLLTLSDGSIAVVTSTRYNGAGHDVRMEVMGSQGSLCAGLDDSLAMTSAQPGQTFPAGPVHHTFMDRFADAYVAELTAFADLARGEIPSPCTIADAVQAARVADAAQRAKDTGTRIDLPQPVTA